MTKQHKLYNLILPISLTRREVLLGFKKRGFGVGKYNGFGGKVDAGETLVSSAQRELQEESGIVCTAEQLYHHAVLILETVAPRAETEKVLEIHVFVCVDWSGEVVETEEMRPQWFAPDKLPLDDMWEETRIWMMTTLELYLPPLSLPPATTSSSPRRILPAELNPPTLEGRGDKKWFIHYVDFCGGINTQTGKWDPWHGMGRSVWEWFDAPLEGWSREKLVTWVQAVRRRVREEPPN